MYFKKFSKQKKKAISPVLATVILIAITLIAAIAVAGFVFGLFGSFTSSARVSASVTSCTHGTALLSVCNITLSNTGTSNATVNGCQFGGALAGVSAALPLSPVTAGGTLAITCTGTGAATVAGQSAVGSVSLSNGASVPFTGTFS